MITISGLGATPFQATGLVGHWKLDETSGTTAADSVGSLVGTYNGSSVSSTNVPPALVNYPFAASRVFDGSNDTVTVPDTPALQITGDITIAFWTYKNSEATDWTRIVGKGNATIRNYGVWEWSGSTGAIKFQQYNAAGGSVLEVDTAAATLPALQWVHVASTLSGTTGSVYLNAGTPVTATRTAAPGTSSDPLVFGHGQPHTYYPGLVCDVRIYNRALAATEVGILHAGLPGPTALAGTAPNHQQVNLTWNAPTNPATAYNVKRATSATGPFTTLTTTPGTTYTDPTVAPSTTYHYRVTAMLSVGESAQSNLFSVTTPAPPPRTDDHDEGLFGDRCSCSTASAPSRAALLGSAGLLLLLLFLRRR